MLKEKIIKAFIGALETPNKHNPNILVIVIQYHNDIIVTSFNSTFFNERFQTGGTDIPMI